MASIDQQTELQMSRKVICSQRKVEICDIKKCDLYQSQSVFMGSNNLGCPQEDMMELKKLLIVAVRGSVKEVIIHKLNVISAKINSLSEVPCKSRECEMNWIQVKNGRKKSVVNPQKLCHVPVTENRFEPTFMDGESYQTSFDR
jgi:hypothetical protein